MLASLRSLITQPFLLSSVIVTALLLGIQRLGVLEPLELKVFDQMVQMRADSGADSRILIVTVTENDLQKWNWPLSGEILDHLFTKLERDQARVIGLDIFRDLRVDPGHDKLLKHIQQSDRIISVCKHSDSTNPAIPQPAGIDTDQVGFSDIIEDTDDIVRRNLLLVSPTSSSPCQTLYSLSLQLVLHYLGMQLKLTSKREIQLGTTTFQRLQSDSGAYHNVDANGYQILLNYRSVNHIAKQVSLTEVLLDQIDPAWVKDRIVLIGSTANSLKDAFNTPYSASQEDNYKMPGVILHAQMVSQILSVVLNGQPLFWFLPEWGKVLWIWGWSLGGGVVAWRIQHPLRLGMVGGVTLGGLLGGNFVIFLHGGWVPVVSPALGLVFTAGSVVAYGTFRSQQQQAKIALQVQEQQRTISLLQALLKESGSAANTVTIHQPVSGDTLLNQRYKVTSPLGAGGFGTTYLAEDTQRPGHPRCVVKHLRPARQEPEFLEVARRLFKTEAEILELLGQHNQIPQLLAYVEENQQFYLVQEFILGHPLQDELTRGKCMLAQEVIDLLKDVLHVLVFVHSHGVIHRDIKPNNLIRRKQDHRLVLIDFGAVKQIQPQPQDEENQTIAIGTAGYAPVEQLMGNPRLNSDIYALGMIGIQALTGTSPQKFQRNPSTRELVIKTNLNASPLVWYEVAKTRADLATILDRMVSYDFNTRYQSVQEVLQSLEKL